MRLKWFIFYRCKCNGHASECILRHNEYGEMQPVCNCSHFTDGVDCEKCLPFYNDAPWGRATKDGVHECKRKSTFQDSSCSHSRWLRESTGVVPHLVTVLVQSLCDGREVKAALVQWIHLELCSPQKRCSWHALHLTLQYSGKTDPFFSHRKGVERGSYS